MSRMFTLKLLSLTVVSRSRLFSIAPNLHRGISAKGSVGAYQAFLYKKKHLTTAFRLRSDPSFKKEPFAVKADPRQEGNFVTLIAKRSAYIMRTSALVPKKTGTRITSITTTTSFASVSVSSHSCSLGHPPYPAFRCDKCATRRWLHDGTSQGRHLPDD